MMPKKLIMATRKSALALAQSRAFARALEAATPGLVIEELQVLSSGDRFQAAPLQDLGGKGLFVKELEEALLDGRADFAVHSMKDVPAALASGLRIACIPVREDARDVLIVRRKESLLSAESRAGAVAPTAEALLRALPDGALVGSSSLRRVLNLREWRTRLGLGTLNVEALRGNIDTRLQRLVAGPWDGIVLAAAGLRRLGAALPNELVAAACEPEDFLPAVGQGALAVEIRSGDDRVADIVAALHDPATATAVAAERAFMLSLDGNCRAPIAAYATRSEQGAPTQQLRLRGFFGRSDLSQSAQAERAAIIGELGTVTSLEAAEALGRALAADIRSQLG